MSSCQRCANMYRLAISSVTLLFLFALAGCGDNSGRRLVTINSSLNFTALTTGPSAPLTAYIQNVGVDTAHISSVTITGANAADFAQTSSCTGDLAPGKSCPVAVTFTSATAGSFSAFLAVQSNSSFGGSAQVALTGTATVPTPVASFSATSLTLPSLTANTGSTSATLTLTDTGTAPLNVGSITLSGVGANLFTDISACGATLAVNASCTVKVNFAPLVPGTYTATLNVPNNATGAQSVTLSGAAAAGALSIDTTNAADWKIANGAFAIDFDPTRGDIFSFILNGTTDQLVDSTTFSGSHFKGFYMDNAGFGTPTGVPGFVNVPATASSPAYLDWWVTYPSNSTNAYTYSMHFVVTPNDPGLHTYFIANHAATDIAGSIGQV